MLELAAAMGAVALGSDCVPLSSLHSGTAFPRTVNLAHPALFPESLDYDDRTGSFVVGSFREGGVYEVLTDGKVRVLVRDPRLISVLGIALDAKRSRLLVTNADLGVARRASTQGPRKLAALGIYDRENGAPHHYVDLGVLVPDRNHLANGVAIDDEGNAYVTDSFASTIYQVAPDGSAKVFLQDTAFDGDGVCLNGLVCHPGGYLLVVKKSDGKLFRVPLSGSPKPSEVALPRALVGADGIVLASLTEAVVISNETKDVLANEVVALASHDEWRTARITGRRAFGRSYPTNGVIAHETLFVMSSGLQDLIAGAPEARERLRNVAVIRAVGEVGPLQLHSPTQDENVGPSVVDREPTHERAK